MSSIYYNLNKAYTSQTLSKIIILNPLQFLFYFEACCWPNYTAHREIQENLKMLHIARQKIHDCKNQPYDEEYNHPEVNGKISSGQAKWHRYQRIIWEVLDEPYSSRVAKVCLSTFNTSSLLHRK